GGGARRSSQEREQQHRNPEHLHGGSPFGDGGLRGLQKNGHTSTAGPMRCQGLFCPRVKKFGAANPRSRMPAPSPPDPIGDRLTNELNSGSAPPGQRVSVHW